MSAKSRGLSRERDVVKMLREDGWFAMRSPASLGVADVIALRGDNPSLFIEVKANVSGGPFMNFRRPERDKLSMAADIAGARAVLIWWPPRKKPSWIYESQWPENLETKVAA